MSWRWWWLQGSRLQSLCWSTSDDHGSFRSCHHWNVERDEQVILSSSDQKSTRWLIFVQQLVWKSVTHRHASMDQHVVGRIHVLIIRSSLRHLIRWSSFCKKFIYSYLYEFILIFQKFFSGRLPSDTIGRWGMVGRDEVLYSSNPAGRDIEIRCKKNFRRWELYKNHSWFGVSVGSVLWLHNLGSILNQQRMKAPLWSVKWYKCES